MPYNYVFTQPGTYRIEDNGIIDDGIAVITDSAGNIVETFDLLHDSLTFTVSTSGVHLIVDLEEDLVDASLTIGSFTDPSLSPDLVGIDRILARPADFFAPVATPIRIASRGAIYEAGPDPDEDIDIFFGVGDIQLSAVTGIGTGNAIEIGAPVAARTVTGGIYLNNNNDHINFGRTSGNDVQGLTVEQSGDIVVTARGNIVASDGLGSSPGPTIIGGAISGNVTLIAQGDVAFNQTDGIDVRAGSLAISAGQDILVGTSTVYDRAHDLIARGSVTLNAGRDITLDNSGTVQAGYGGGTTAGMTVMAGNRIDTETLAGQTGFIGHGSGNIAITASTLWSGDLSSAAGDIVVTVDKVLFGGSIVAGGGDFTLRTPAGRAFGIGNEVYDVVAAFELQEIVADRLMIGSLAGGRLTVAQSLSSLPNLTLLSGSDIVLKANITTANHLAMIAGDSVFTASGVAIGAASLNLSVDAVQDDGGTGGRTSFGASFSSPPLVITGAADADTLNGTSGNDTLDGRGGADTLRGGAGDDWYYVDNAGDTVIEAVGEGTDRVYASVSYTLAGGVQVEQLRTTAVAGTSAINLTGNGLSQSLLGNAGDNVLDGKGGADTLVGRGGNDSYYVDHAGDVVTEVAGEGTDRVYASVSYVLAAGVEVETLSTINVGGTAAINLTGNGLGQNLFGNAGDNVLDGKGGADTMAGRGGDDWYYVDNAGDVVIEAVGEGTDRVYASVSYTLAGGVQVEQLRTTAVAGTSAINLTGNGLSQSLLGNAGNNVLDGRGGADTLQGFGGDDWYYVDNAGDTVIEAVGEGTDRVYASVSYTLAGGVQVEQLRTTAVAGTSAINLTGNGLSQSLLGNAGNNVLDGKGGADTMQGFGGADTFRFTTALGGNNIDTIVDYLVADDTIQLDNAVFTGLADGALAASAFRIGAAAADATDRIIYNSATGALLFDADGIGGVAAVQFATLSTGLAMTAAEFVVI